MRAALCLGLFALGCSPVSVEGGRFGEENFFGVAAVAAQVEDRVIIVIHTDAASCDDVPTSTPLRRILTLQAPFEVGAHDRETSSATLVTDVCGTNSRVVNADEGVLEVLRLDDEIEGAWNFMVDDVPASGRFVSPLCDDLPVPVRDCGDPP